MENDIFKAGVRPGSPTSHDEVKMLICYILSNLPCPMGFADLHEALSEQGLVNYFELVQVMEGLLKTGHIALEPASPDSTAELYRITAIGLQAGDAFESTLPLSVRRKALESAEKRMRQRKRESEVSIQIRKREEGYQMELSIPEMGETLVSFTLFLPTYEECETVRRRFLNDPVYIYKGVMALLSGNREVLGKIFPEKPIYEI